MCIYVYIFIYGILFPLRSFSRMRDCTDKLPAGFSGDDINAAFGSADVIESMIDDLCPTLTKALVAKLTLSGALEVRRYEFIIRLIFFFLNSVID